MTRIGSLARPATAWWRLRSGRERTLLGAMAAAMLAYLLAVGVVQPLVADRRHALDAIARHDAGLARLAARPDVAAASTPAAGGPVTAIVTDTAPDYDLAIRRIEAVGDGARLDVEEAGFAELILWIEELEVRHGLSVTAVEMDRRPEPGTVGARLTVTR